MDYRKNEILCKILDLKFKLRDTDYITNKFTEAMINYMLDGDKTKLSILYIEYKDILEQRKAWRDEINALEIEFQIEQHKNA